MKRGTSSVYLLAIVSIFFVVAIFLITDNLNTTGNTALSPEVKEDVELLGDDSLPDIDCSKYVGENGNANDDIPSECVQYSGQICFGSSNGCQVMADPYNNGVDYCYSLVTTRQSLCCPHASDGVGPDGPYSYSSYGTGNACCSQEIKEEKDGVTTKKLIPIIYDLFQNENNNDLFDLGCCEGEGTFNKESQTCCADDKGENEIKDNPTNGCPACGCYGNGNANCDDCTPNPIAIELMKNTDICAKGCYVSSVCRSGSSNHASGCGVDIKCPEGNYDDFGDNINGFFEYPACLPGQGRWTDQSPCCKKHSDNDTTGNLVDSDDDQNHIHCQTC